MRIGSRVFPYPVLNRDPSFSEYPSDCTFQLKIDLDDSLAPVREEDLVILSNVRFEISCSLLEKYLACGKIKGALIVECPETVFRKQYPISTVGADISIPISNFKGTVEVSCYLYAAEPLSNFGACNLPEGYEDATIDLEKYDIVAVDDGFNFKVTVDPCKDNNVASIFKIIRLEDNPTMQMGYSVGEGGITIQLPARYYERYDNLAKNPDLNNISFAIIGIPVLACCLQDIRNNDYETLDEISNEYRWFNAIRAAYKQATGNELEFDTFQTENQLEIAQLVLNHASCQGIEDFCNVLLGDAVANSFDVEEDGE